MLSRAGCSSVMHLRELCCKNRHPSANTLVVEVGFREAVPFRERQEGKAGYLAAAYAAKTDENGSFCAILNNKGDYQRRLLCIKARQSLLPACTQGITHCEKLWPGYEQAG